MKPYLQRGLLFGGLVSGVIGLLLMTRNLIGASMNELYAVTIYFNRSGEYWFDVIAVIVLWVLWVVGLFMYYKYLKEVKAI